MVNAFLHISNLARQYGARLVVVAKNQSISDIQRLVDAGATHIAFHRLPEAEQKYALLSGFSGRKVFLGHLQSNKVKKVVRLFDEIHSVDSLHLAEILSRSAQAEQKQMPILLQVNIDADPQKFGFSPSGLREAGPFLARLSGIQINGLMTLGKKGKDPQETYSAFSTFFQEIRSENFFSSDFQELSMGMSADYPVALENGATMIRVGTALFS